jgi:hypothetical protein
VPYSALPVTAQVRWEAGAEVGAKQMLSTDAGRASPAPLPGPDAEAHAYVAVLPMLRAGPYLAAAVAPFSGAPAWTVGAAGLSIKISPPLLAGHWRTWFFAGIGYTLARSPGRLLVGSLGATSVETGARDGQAIQIPFGFALGYEPHRPWEYFVSLAFRVGAAFTGALYNPVGGCPGSASASVMALCRASFEGQDSFAVTLNVGVNFTR